MTMDAYTTVEVIDSDGKATELYNCDDSFYLKNSVLLIVAGFTLSVLFVVSIVSIIVILVKIKQIVKYVIQKQINVQHVLKDFIQMEQVVHHVHQKIAQIVIQQQDIVRNVLKEIMFQIMLVQHVIHLYPNVSNVVEIKHVKHVKMDIILNQHHHVKNVQQNQIVTIVQQ